jgi:hypothetical protein
MCRSLRPAAEPIRCPLDPNHASASCFSLLNINKDSHLLCIPLRGAKIQSQVPEIFLLAREGRLLPSRPIKRIDHEALALRITVYRRANRALFVPAKSHSHTTRIPRTQFQFLRIHRRRSIEVRNNLVRLAAIQQADVIIQSFERIVFFGVLVQRVL